MGEVRGATFVRLMESLVESVLLYGGGKVECNSGQLKMYRCGRQESF